MKHRMLSSLVRMGAFSGMAVWGIGLALAESPPPARIAQFAGDRPAAISYTFDDGLRDQWTLAVPMLNEVGFKGTFFVIPGATVETREEAEKKQNDKRAWGSICWPELQEMSNQGHEIGSHTWSHPGLVKLSPEQVGAEFSKACDAIKSRIGKPALTLAFPFNQSTPVIQSAALKYHVAYRAFQASTGGKSTEASLNAWAEKLVQEKKWGVMMTHGIAVGYAAMSDPEIFHAHLKYVHGRASEIWVDTFAHVALYEKEREAAKLSVTPRSGGFTCQLSSDLDESVFDVPLTIVIPAPAAKVVRAERGGRELPARVVAGAIQVDAAPASEPISISWR